MIYLIGAIAILANIFFYIFLKFSLWILFFNILIFFIFIILIKSHKEYQNLESKKKLITNYNTELGKNDLERLFIDKIEDGIIILNVFNVIIYANKSASNNFGEKLEGKHISAAVRISDLLDKIDQHRLSQKKFIEIMKLEANKMETLIEDLLTLSRIEQQEHILINNKVNIKKIIEDVVVLISKRIKKKKISLKVDLDEDQKFVIGDPEKLSILFLNLIDNAIKFSNPLKTIEIKILKVDEIFKKFISISIIDEGIGINEEDIHRITERFFRAENTRKLKIEGTGLGLAIVKHIINQHGGELKIISKVGLGSEFIVRLPKA